jgi:hypothetical protein
MFKALDNAVPAMLRLNSLFASTSNGLVANMCSIEQNISETLIHQPSTHSALMNTILTHAA